jgi:UDP-N-acetylmuramoyl-L-alanyl-D-glutamate--2,6-diaminopimelate ligase
MIGNETIPVRRSLSGFLEFEKIASARGARYIVVEVTSLALSQGFADAWPCDVALLTNITYEHINVHQDFTQYRSIKERLFRGLHANGTAILNAGDESCVTLTSALKKDVQLITYGWEGPGNYLPPTVSVSCLDLTLDRTLVEMRSLRATERPVRLEVPAPGLHFAENAVAAFLAAIVGGADERPAAEAIGSTCRPAGRFDLLARHPLIVVDFAHTPDGIRRTLQTVRHLTQGRITVVFGAGGNNDHGKRPLMGAAAAEYADEIVLTTDNSRFEDTLSILQEIESGIHEKCTVKLILDRREAIISSITQLDTNDALAVLGRGHEEFLHLKGSTIALSDHQVARETISQIKGSQDELLLG